MLKFKCLKGTLSSSGPSLSNKNVSYQFLFYSFFNKFLAYFFNGGKGYGIFTWSSCKVRITGKTESAYISKDTPMVQYLNVSFAIEGLRKKAEEREDQVDNQGNPLDARVCF